MDHDPGNSIPGDQIAGHANVVGVQVCNNLCSSSPAGVTVTVTDTHSNTYTLVDEATTTSNVRMLIFVATNIAGGSSNSFTVNTSGCSSECNYVSGFLAEFEDVKTSALVDLHESASGSAEDPSITTSGSSSQNDEIVIGLARHDGASLTVTDNELFNAGNYSAMQFKTVSSTGTQTTSFNTTNTNNYGIVIVTLKIEAGSPPATGPTLGLLGVGR